MDGTAPTDAPSRVTSLYVRFFGDPNVYRVEVHEMGTLLASLDRPYWVKATYGNLIGEIQETMVDLAKAYRVDVDPDPEPIS